jgi:hypothetical protein
MVSAAQLGLEWYHNAFKGVYKYAALMRESFRQAFRLITLHRADIQCQSNPRALGCVQCDISLGMPEGPECQSNPGVLQCA